MTLRRALSLIGLFALVVFALRLAARSWVDPEQPLQPTPVFWVLWMLSSAIGAWLVSRESVLRGHGTWQALGWTKDGLGLRALLGIPTGVVAIAVVVLAGMSVGLTWQEVVEVVQSGPPAQRLVYVAIGLQAAFVEESLFRGNLLPLVVAKWGRVGGWLATAAVFSAYHLDPRPLSLATKFVLGLLYGAVRSERSGSLVANGVGHFMVWVFVGAL